MGIMWHRVGEVDTGMAVGGDIEARDTSRSCVPGNLLRYILYMGLPLVSLEPA